MHSVHGTHVHNVMYTVKWNVKLIYYSVIQTLSKPILPTIWSHVEIHRRLVQCGFNFLWNAMTATMQCNAIQCNAMRCRWLLSSDTDGQHTWTDHTLRVMHEMANIIRNVQSCFNTISLHEQCILLLRLCQLLCF